ncbi:hypothetical protein C8Q72DRAFT_827224 [Fomitopsis betulina]|nr:hypothetical protein C8Q72DRAFT_827224 [Fomitopsis betulina]
MCAVNVQASAVLLASTVGSLCMPSISPPFRQSTANPNIAHGVALFPLIFTLPLLLCSSQSQASSLAFLMSACEPHIARMDLRDWKAHLRCPLTFKSQPIPPATQRRHFLHPSGDDHRSSQSLIIARLPLPFVHEAFSRSTALSAYVL